MFFSRVRIEPEFFKTTQLKRILSDSTYNIHQLLWDLFSGQKKRNFLYREEIAREQFGTQTGIHGEPVFYIVSSTRPALDNPVFQVEMKEYQPKFQPCDRLYFELRANPVIAKNGKKHDVVMDAQRAFLKKLCAEFNLQSHLSANPKKREFKKALLTHGDHGLDERLISLLKDDFRYAEQLRQSMKLHDKLEWSIKAIVDVALNNWLARKGEMHGFLICRDDNNQYKLQNSTYRWQSLDKKAGKGVKSGFSSVDFVGELEVTDIEIFTKALFEGVGRSKAFGCGLMLVKRIQGK